MSPTHRHILAGFVVVLAVSIAGVACEDQTSPSAAEAHFTCGIDELIGAFRVHYVELEGQCGPIRDRTANILGLGSGGPKQGDCVFASHAVSIDKCSIDYDYRCTSGDLEEHWTGRLSQTSSTTLASTMTLEVTGRGTCQSVYAITYTRL